MKNVYFKEAHFLLSALEAKEFPVLKLPNGRFMPEIALVGRSNAGKSSFLNALLQSKNLAKTSSKPGKTQRINFFLVEESLLLVDLPGYGYAKAPKDEIAQWSRAIDDYLNHRPTLQLLILILDIRRKPSPEDLAIKDWAVAKGISLFVLFTKRDKLSDTEVEKALNANLSALHKEGIAGFLAISNPNFYERRRFIQMINEEIKWD